MIGTPDCAMDKIVKSFAPFIGEMVWQVRRGHGSFLTMEFGLPHLAIREPIAARPDVSARVRRNLERRAVAIVGDWHFWVQYSDWKIVTPWGELRSDDGTGSPADECLSDLEGQRLVSVGPGDAAGSCAFNFDLRAILQISPSAEIPDDLWSLHGWNGDIVTCRNDGALVFEKADPSTRVFKPLANAGQQRGCS